MPVYEFKCNNCNIVFSEIRKIGDFKAPKCPECSSNLTEKIFSLFSGAKSESCVPSAGG